MFYLAAQGAESSLRIPGISNAQATNQQLPAQKATFTMIRVFMIIGNEIGLIYDEKREELEYLSYYRLISCVTEVNAVNDMSDHRTRSVDTKWGRRNHDDPRMDPCVWPYGSTH